MELFQIDNKIAFPSIHALLIEPFKTIWEGDDSKDKSVAIKIFSYVELLCNPKKSNPFAGYSEEIRIGKVKKEVWGDENYQHSQVSLIIQAVQKYKQLLTNSSPSYVLYLSAMTAKDELTKFFNDVDLTERTNSGTAVYKPKDITSALREVSEVMKSLEVVREKLYTDLAEEGKTRNQRKIGHYEG